MDYTPLIACYGLAPYFVSSGLDHLLLPISSVNILYWIEQIAYRIIACKLHDYDCLSVINHYHVIWNRTRVLLPPKQNCSSLSYNVLIYAFGFYDVLTYNQDSWIRTNTTCSQNTYATINTISCYYMPNRTSRITWHIVE